MIQLMITDIDVIAAIVTDREAEPFATASQSGLDQVWVIPSQQPVTVAGLDHPQTTQSRESRLQRELVVFVGEFEAFRQNSWRRRSLNRQLIQDVGDREFHRG